MQQTELAAGRDHTTLNTTALNDTAASVGATSDKTVRKFSKAAPSDGPRSTPATLDETYLTAVLESGVYEEVL